MFHSIFSIHLQKSDVLFFVGCCYFSIEAVFFQGDGYLGSMLVELEDAEVLLEGCYHVVVDHVLPTSVELI